MRILITGAGGKVGTGLWKELKREHDIVSVDISEDVLDRSFYRQLDIATDYQGLRDAVSGCDAVVHLAWDTAENLQSDEVVPENKKMAENVYRACEEVEVPKLVVASSIHAAGWKIKEEPYRSIALGEKNLSEVEKVSRFEVSPDSPYGASKVYIEALGKYYSSDQLDVMAVRLGALGKEPGDKPENADWFSHSDFATLVNYFVDNEFEGNYHQLYGVSNNSNCVYSLENDIGWEPSENALD